MLLSLILILFFYCMLRYAGLSVFYAANGLNLWFTKMIPTLLPFMILSNIANKMNLTEKIASIVSPILSPVFQVGKNVIYCVLLGFLCGFPMGARVTADLYREGKLTRPEADYLLSFCNNIGPIYFFGYALPLLGLRSSLPYAIGMYGIPLLWGIILRYTKYRNKINTIKKLQLNLNHQKRIISERPVFLQVLEESIISSLSAIAALGGYMVLFNCINLPLHVITGRNPVWLSPVLEISGGLSGLGSASPIYSLTILSFGGLSCVAQTYSSIRNTDLQMKDYIINRIVITVISALYYVGLFCFLL